MELQYFSVSMLRGTYQVSFRKHFYPYFQVTEGP